MITEGSFFPCQVFTVTTSGTYADKNSAVVERLTAEHGQSIICIFLKLKQGPKAGLGQYELLTDINTKAQLSCTIGNGDPMHGVCIISMEERNLVTKRKRPKQVQTNAQALTIMVLGGRDSSYHTSY